MHGPRLIPDKTRAIGDIKADREVRGGAGRPLPVDR